jgi:hypothetical protein
MALPVDEQQWLAAWNSRRATPIIEIADPDVEVHAVTLGIEGRHYHGYEGLKDWMRDIRDRFDAYSTAETIEPLGEDAVLVNGTLYIKTGYGDEEQQRFAMVIHLKDDRARWIGTFFSASDARSAYEAGVTGPTPG